MSAKLANIIDICSVRFEIVHTLSPKRIFSNRLLLVMTMIIVSGNLDYDR